MILILNCGSQSIKLKIFNKNFDLIREKRVDVFNKKYFGKILKKELSKIKEKISIIGHRVVHGGGRFVKPTIVNKKLLAELKKISALAPLHNSFNILGIEICLNIFPKAKNIAVFDTAFFAYLPEKASVYSLPEKLRKKIKRFGFHGTSHEYVARKGAKIIKRDFNKLKIISCHLGGGASVSAIKNGKAVDTSMGYTPMEGLMMMTRSGDIDPGIVIELGEKAKNVLNYQSGVKALCGKSDMRDVLKLAKRGDKKAKLALDIFVYRIKKYIGAYRAVLGGCDLLVFTGAIGFGSAQIRKMVCKDLSILKNTEIIAIEPNEELAIAQKLTEFLYKL